MALPDHDVIHKLVNLPGPEDEFAEGELFLHKIGRIKKFVPLLKNLAFKAEYPSVIEETRRDIVSTRAAFDELMNSKKFEKVSFIFFYFKKTIVDLIICTSFCCFYM